MIKGGMENDMQLTPSGRLKPVAVCGMCLNPKAKGEG